jgi:hypothetical protein
MCRWSLPTTYNDARTATTTTRRNHLLLHCTCDTPTNNGLTSAIPKCGWHCYCDISPLQSTQLPSPPLHLMTIPLRLGMAGPYPSPSFTLTTLIFFLTHAYVATESYIIVCSTSALPFPRPSPRWMATTSVSSMKELCSIDNNIIWLFIYNHVNY